MLHFALQSSGLSPISDDMGLSGLPIFDGDRFDSTIGGAGTTKDLLIFVFNNDTNYQYNSPIVSLSGADAILTKAMFKFLDNKNVVGSVPKESEWTTYGVAGTSTMLIDDITKAGGATPERKIWLRCVIPAGLSSANLTNLKLMISAIEEAV